MTVHSFKNGIEIHIPDDLSNLEEEWISVKMAMSLILNPNPPEVELREKKPYDMSRRAAQIKRRTKTWRSPKKLKQ